MAPSTSGDNRRDRRRHPRFRTAGDVYAVLRNHPERVGPVFDISRGGLSFRYIEEGSTRDGADFIDLFATRERVMVEKVPVRTISDFPVDQDVPYSTVSVRQRGVQFLTVKPAQQRMLDTLLRHHTVCTAS